VKSSGESRSGTLVESRRPSIERGPASDCGISGTDRVRGLLRLRSVAVQRLGAVRRRQFEGPMDRPTGQKAEQVGRVRGIRPLGRVSDVASHVKVPRFRELGMSFRSVADDGTTRVTK